MGPFLSLYGRQCSLLAGIRRQSTRRRAVAPTAAVRTAREAALAYYDNYNKKDIPAVLELIAEDCVYEDLIYQDPFRGRAAIAKYFEKIEQLVPPDIQFVVEDITDGDPKKVGVRWHVELENVAQFPFSRGVSFYEVDDDGRIVFARDIVEPTFKPGAAALQGISVVAPLVRKLGPNADPANLGRLPIAAGAMASFYAFYIFYVLLSTSAPGDPAWQTSPEVLQSVLNESYNFFYVNVFFSQFGLNPVPSIAEHPVSEALFNFVNAWSLMMLPAWMADPKGQKVDNKLPIWIGTMFLTNVFLPLYMTLRLVPEPEVATPPPQPAQLPKYAPAFGATALAVGVVSLAWAAAARPEYGGIAERAQYFSEQYASDRVFWAFCVDSCLYSVWQAWVLGAAGASAWQRFVPFFGMAGWLLQGAAADGEEKKT